MREMDEYSFNLKASERKSLRSSIGTPFILLVLFILLLIHLKTRNADAVFSAILAVALLFFIYIAAVPLQLLFRPDPLVRLTAVGIEERRFGCGVISWGHVLEVQPRFELSRSGPVAVLDIRLYESKNYIRRIPFYLWLSLPTRTFFKGVIPIPFSDLDGELEDAVDWIRSYLHEVHIAGPVEGEDLPV